MKKKIKSVLSLFMCLLIFLSVPSTVYAKDYEFNNLTVTARTNTKNYVFTVTPPRWVFDSTLQTEFKEINVLSNNTFSFNDDDTISFSYRIGEGQNRYLGFEDINIIITSLNYDYPACVFGCELQKNNSSSPSAWSYWNNGATYYQNGVDKYLEPDACYLDYDYSTSVLTGYITSPVGYDDCKILIQFGKPVYGSNVTSSTTFAFGATSFELQTESYAASMFAQISDFFANLAERLTGWFDSLFGWLKDIRDNASEGFSNIGDWFSELGNKIQTFFNNLSDNINGFFIELGNKISGFFTDLKNNLKTWFDNIGNWFTEIGDKISGFFEKLWNRIYWGNENGESEYQKPVINNKLNDILDTMDGYQQQLNDVISTINTSADEVSTYISTGTQLIEGFINVGGVGLTALIVFGMVFILVRKVVGR